MFIFFTLSFRSAVYFILIAKFELVTIQVLTRVTWLTAPTTLDSADTQTTVWQVSSCRFLVCPSPAHPKSTTILISIPPPQLNFAYS